MTYERPPQEIFDKTARLVTLAPGPGGAGPADGDSVLVTLGAQMYHVGNFGGAHVYIQDPTQVHLFTYDGFEPWPTP